MTFTKYMKSAPHDHDLRSSLSPKILLGFVTYGDNQCLEILVYPKNRQNHSTLLCIH